MPLWIQVRLQFEKKDKYGLCENPDIQTQNLMVATIMKHQYNLWDNAKIKLEEEISEYWYSYIQILMVAEQEDKKNECPEGVFFWLLRVGRPKAGWSFTLCLYRKPDWQCVKQRWPKRSDWKRKTSDHSTLQNFVMNWDRLWTDIHNFSPLYRTILVKKPR